MNPWAFQNPVEVRFGGGSRKTIATALSGRDGLLIVTTVGRRARPLVSEVVDSLGGRQPIVLDDVEPNPTLEYLESKIRSFVDMPIGDIVAIGGGSVLDSAKVISVGLSVPGFDLRDHFVAGTLLPERRSNTLVCLPTTAGSGSEVTPFATVWDGSAKKKLSMTGAAVFPDCAILDHDLTSSVPKGVTTMTGLDAITQAFEAIWSRRGNALSTAAAIRSIRRGLGTLAPLRENPGDGTLREAMLECSLLAGWAISVSRTALCHAISYPLTLHLGIPHGLACGFVLPEVFSFNRETDPARFESLSHEIGLDSAADLQLRLRRLMDELEIGDLLRGYGLTRDSILALAPEMLAPGRADNNLRGASVEDVCRILNAALGGRGL